MTALEQVIFVALTFVGPRWETSRPMIIVHAASLEVLRLAVTLRTLTLCGCNWHNDSNAHHASQQGDLPDSNRLPRPALESSRQL